MKGMAFPETIDDLSDAATVAEAIDSRAFSDFCCVDFRIQVPDGDTEALNSRGSNSISCLL